MDASFSRHDFLAVTSGSDSLVDVPSDSEILELSSGPLDPQTSSDYANAVKFPAILGDITTTLGNITRPILCYATVRKWDSSEEPQFVLLFGQDYDKLGYSYVYADLVDDHFVFVSGQNNNSGRPSSFSLAPSCVRPSLSPLYYGVNSISSSGGDYPTETIFTLLSIGIFIFIIWACFRIFIYPFYRRISR